MRIFLSYAHKDRRFAQDIAYALKTAGHDVFFDRDSLTPGFEFHARIRQEVSESELFIFLVSPHSVERGGYALSELKFAKKKWPNPSGAVLPVQVRKTSPHLIDRYLSAVTLLTPDGNPAAEVASHVSELEKHDPQDAKQKFQKPT